MPEPSSGRVALPPGYALRPLSPDDAPGLAAAYDRNRAHLGPWDPDRDERFFTAAGQRAAVRAQLEKRDAGLLDAWVLHGPDGDVAGRVNLQNIVRGTMQGGTLGYWVGVDHLRRGLATALVEGMAVRGRALGLHRLEADTMVENTASQRVLERCGFERYGLAPSLLFLRGAWRDHVMFQRLLHDEPLR